MSAKAVWVGIAALLIGITAWDVYLYVDGIPGNSISQVIIDAASVSSLVPFFVGFLFGALGLHWFDSYREPRK